MNEIDSFYDKSYYMDETYIKLIVFTLFITIHVFQKHKIIL